MDTITKTHLIAALATKTGLSTRICADVLNAALQEITDQLKRGRAVRLTGFGTFTTSQRKARQQRAITSGDQITIPAHRVAYFHVGDLLRHQVAGTAPSRKK